MIALRSVKKYYAGRLALDIPELVFERGMRYALVGENGSGKTTLLRVLAGVVAPDEGIVETGGGILAYMPQKSVAFDMSVARNLRCSGADEDKIALFAKSLALESLMKKRASRLSGGETQRVALARTLGCEYTALLLDEPTAALDAHIAPAARELLLAQAIARGATLIVATHSPDEAVLLADTVITLADGAVVKIAPAADICLQL